MTWKSYLPHGQRETSNNNKNFMRYFIKDCGMSRTCFQNILSALHICDLEKDIENQCHKTLGPEYNPLLNVKPLMDRIQHASTSYFAPYRNISMDERMVASKGRLSI